MNIRFANDEIREYTHGPSIHFKNEGKAFAVDDSMLADELLHAKAWVGGEMVAVFEPASNQKPSESVEGYPDGFPSADVLAREGFSYEEVRLLDRDQLIEIKGIGPKTADAILDHTKEN